MLRSLLVVTIASVALLTGCTASPDPELSLTLTDPDPSHDRIAKLCDDASLALSDLFNAQDGFSQKAFDASGYTERVQHGQDAMADLAAEDHPEGQAELETLAAAFIVFPTAPPNDPIAATEDLAAAMSPLSDLCSANDSELYVNAEFGG